MSSRTVTLSTTASSESAPSLSPRRANSGNIHTLQDFRRSVLSEDRELADLLNRARSTFDQTRELAAKNRTSLDNLDRSLTSSNVVVKGAEEGQKKLHERISSTNKKLSEAKHEISEAKRALAGTLVTFGMIATRQAMQPTRSLNTGTSPSSSNSESHSSNRSNQQHRWMVTQSLVGEDGEPIEYGGHIEADSGTLVSLQRSTTAPIHQAVNRSVDDSLLPRNPPIPTPNRPPLTNFTANFVRACDHNGRGDTSLADIAEHVGNGEFGSAARDMMESQSTRDAFETIGEQIIRNESDWNDRDWGSHYENGRK